MPLLDFSGHIGDEGVVRRFVKQYPILKDGSVVNTVVLSNDKKEIHVFLYEGVSLPATFEGLKIRTHM